MSEWPRRVPIDVDPDELEGRWSPEQLAEVIPADLGRELYEALKDATAAKFEPLDPEVRNQYLELLARYEREVGE